MPVARHASLAGKLLQGKRRALVFVGASLLANRGSPQALPQANNWWHASACKGVCAGERTSPLAGWFLGFVGASLLANRGSPQAPPQANNWWQASSCKFKLRYKNA